MAKMRNKYVALYIQGRKIPVGAMSEGIASIVIQSMKNLTGGSYEIKPTTKAEARQINGDLTKGYEGLENLIRRYEKK